MKPSFSRGSTATSEYGISISATTSRPATFLASIDTPDLDEELKVARAKLESLKADVKLAEAAAEFARITHVRFQTAAPEGVVSRRRPTRRSRSSTSAWPSWNRRRPRWRWARRTCAGSKTWSRFKQVVAPFDGVVTRRPVDIGDLVTAGSTANTTPCFSPSATTETARVFVEVPQVARAEHQRRPSGRRDRAGVPRAASSRARWTAPPRRLIRPRARCGSKCSRRTPTAPWCRACTPRSPSTAGMSTLPSASRPARCCCWCTDRTPPSWARTTACTSARSRSAATWGISSRLPNGLSAGESVALNISNEIAEGEKVTPVAANVGKVSAASAEVLGAGAE